MKSKEPAVKEPEKFGAKPLLTLVAYKKRCIELSDENRRLRRELGR